MLYQADTTIKTRRARETGAKTGVRATRVLIVAASLRSPGGQAVQARRLIDAFQKDPEIEIGFLPINPRFSGVLSFLQKIKYVRTVLTLFKFGWFLLKTVPRYDVVQAFSASHTSYLVSTLPPLFLAKLFGKKIILNYHCGEAEAHLGRWRWIVPQTMRMFDRIIVPSEFLVDVFARHGFAATAIYNFVDGEKFAFRRRERLAPVFLANRNLEAHYNVGCVLRAFARIQRERPEARLLLAGDGSERAALEKLAEELDVKNVEFLGQVAHDRMPGLYDRADVYLNSSNVDNMPLSIIEAFACGLPVATTDAGGISLLVEHEKTGLLVEKDDCAGLARESARLLADDRLAQTIISRARRKCAENYSWASVREKWLKVYKGFAR